MRMNELRSSFTHSIPGYLVKPAEMFDLDRDKGYSFAITFFAAISVTLVVIYYCFLYAGIGGGMSVSRLLGSIMNDILFISGYFLLQILVLLTIIHLAARYVNRDAQFIHSFTITFISYTYMSSLLMAPFMIVQIVDSYILNGSLPILKVMDYVLGPSFIAAILIFVWVAANGIQMLHGPSTLKSYAIAIVAIAAAFAAIYLYGLVYFSQFTPWG
ncbi:hypothetical protein [Methanoculleus sp. UBA312]|mgnify:CR=1 FL=1|jgi:hypothetical protein|uniref:hypothetical protein n=1 Tax=Methanoculleus sp. UBA312 TaxID=1915499 RepID=UPI0031BA6A73